MSTSIYVFDGNDESELLNLYEDINDEHEAIQQYLASINKEATNFRFLGELSGMVYRMSFEMTVDNVTKEYMVVVNSLS